MRLADTVAEQSTMRRATILQNENEGRNDVHVGVKRFDHCRRPPMNVTRQPGKEQRRNKHDDAHQITNVFEIFMSYGYCVDAHS